MSFCSWAGGEKYKDHFKSGENLYTTFSEYFNQRLYYRRYGYAKEQNHHEYEVSRI